MKHEEHREERWQTGATMEWPIQVTILIICLNLSLSSINLTNVSRVLLTF